MKTQQRKPSTPLAPFVECYWYVNATPEETTIRPDKIIPNGTVNLIFNLSGCPHREYRTDDLTQWSPLRNRWISGIRDRFICVGPTVCTHVVGIRFKPGGLSPFLRMSVSEIRDRTLDPDDLWRGSVATLHEQIYATENLLQRFSLLESWLFQQAGHGLDVDPRLRFSLTEIARTSGQVPISAISRETGLSPKQLRRHFDREVGLSPKRLARLLRFQSVILNLETLRGPVDWAAVAVRFGYFDQSHLTAEFHEFAGLTPGQYLSKKSAILNFIPVDEPVSLFSNTSNSRITTLT